jgi:hypothetical protein
MSERLSLSNVDVAQDEDFDEIEIDDSHTSSGWGTFGSYQLVGGGTKTNENCGRFRGHWGCVRTELHEFPLQSDDKKWAKFIIVLFSLVATDRRVLSVMRRVGLVVRLARLRFV